MNEIIALFVVASALAGAVVFHAREAAAWRAERSRLLSDWLAERGKLNDRIMAKNYTDYVYTTTTAAADVTAPPEPPDTDWHKQNMKDHPEQYPDGEVWE